MLLIGRVISICDEGCGQWGWGHDKGSQSGASEPGRRGWQRRQDGWQRGWEVETMADEVGKGGTTTGVYDGEVLEVRTTTDEVRVAWAWWGRGVARVVGWQHDWGGNLQHKQCFLPLQRTGIIASLTKEVKNHFCYVAWFTISNEQAM
jgi:hypothetical protein